eukprot:jgi/Ulvmu1/9568/UM053_0058.1
MTCAACICTFATAAAIAAALLAQPAAANLDATCADAATGFLALFAKDIPTAYTTAGCAAAENGDICEIRGTAGLCESNPACPENQLSNFGCTSATDAAACCFEEITIPCDGCDPIVLECLSFCDGPSPPPPTDTENRDGFCADVADLRLPGLEASDDNDEAFSSDCSTAAVGQVCDLQGVSGACSAVPDCAGLATFETRCDGEDGFDTACCDILLAKPCASCEPEPATCATVCGSLPASTAAPSAAPTVAQSGLPELEEGPPAAVVPLSISVDGASSPVDDDIVIFGSSDAPAEVPEPAAVLPVPAPAPEDEGEDEPVVAEPTVPVVFGEPAAPPDDEGVAVDADLPDLEVPPPTESAVEAGDDGDVAAVPDADDGGDAAPPAVSRALGPVAVDEEGDGGDVGGGDGATLDDEVPGGVSEDESGEGDGEAPPSILSPSVQSAAARLVLPIISVWGCFLLGSLVLAV